MFRRAAGSAFPTLLTPSLHVGTALYTQSRLTTVTRGTTTLRQDIDPTVVPFMQNGRTRMGQRGIMQISAGQTPSPEHIRETSIAYPQYRTGQGLHEWIPTNLGSSLAAISDAGLRQQMAQAQGGLRSTPAMTPLRLPPDLSPPMFGGHTGTYINQAATGSTHTNVQKAAHDHLRAATETAVQENISHESLVVHMTNAQLEVTPHGRDLLDASELTGALPNTNSLSHLEAPGFPPGPNRFAHAQEVHEAREEVKARGRALVRSIPKRDKRDRSPSPQRSPIKADGTGGEPIASDTKTSRTATLPPIHDSEYKTYQQSEWVSQPMRAIRK